MRVVSTVINLIVLYIIFTYDVILYYQLLANLRASLVVCHPVAQLASLVVYHLAPLPAHHLLSRLRNRASSIVCRLWVLSLGSTIILLDTNLIDI